MVFSVMEKLVSNEQKMGSASEKGGLPFARELSIVGGNDISYHLFDRKIT
jgi:hypothetical protein